MGEPQKSPGEYPSNQDDKVLETSWGQVVLSTGLVLVGLFCTCFCTGLSVYGDYTGPPEGLAESNREKMNHLTVFAVIGLIFIIAGIYGVTKAQKYRS